MSKRNSLVEIVTNDLRTKIKKDTFSGYRLPSEPELALKFDVSRNTIRQALTSLEAEGIINRKHGAGTFISQHVINIGNRLDEVWDFEEMIKNSGFSPSIQHVELSLIAPSELVTNKLSLSKGDEVLRTANIFLADEMPVIYCVDYIPARIIRSAYEENELYGPVYEFLKKRCHQLVEQNITEILSVISDNELSEFLSCAPGSPIHYFRELALNENDEPIMYSDEYYCPEHFSFYIVRKMIYP
ncbi:MAG: GntR family transcriptional regulator [Anaerolineales bacterium]